MATSNTIALLGLDLQCFAVLLGAISAYCIWRQLKEVALAGQANVSEQLASQSIDIIKCIAEDRSLYEYLYQNKPLSEEARERAKVLCCAEMMANFLEHIVLQKPSLPRTSRQAWMLYVRDHYNSSCVVRAFIAEHDDWYADVFLKFVTNGQARG